MGCDNLIVVVDHRPLVKIFGDRRLDEISNPRLMRLKQKTLKWYFEVEYQPGKSNYFADATSRRPSTIVDHDTDCSEEQIVAGIIDDVDRFFAVTLDVVQGETQSDNALKTILTYVSNGFPTSAQEMPGCKLLAIQTRLVR